MISPIFNRLQFSDMHENIRISYKLHEFGFGLEWLATQTSQQANLLETYARLFWLRELERSVCPN
jgi:hypothetical protein